ncbi:hypothetical protein EAE96_001646 [Botrytis aclada]|nr:hypothetical protein EAE96_001646 [Botrytis aclada]
MPGTIMTCNSSNDRHCFESCDHLERFKSFKKFTELQNEGQHKLDKESWYLTQEHEKVNRIYANLLNEFTGYSIKVSPPNRRDYQGFRRQPLDVLIQSICNQCICCDCFLEHVAYWLETVIEADYMQAYLDIFRVEHQELVEKTLSLRHLIDNNQVHADELADMLEAEDRLTKRNKIYRRRWNNRNPDEEEEDEEEEYEEDEGEGDEDEEEEDD